MVIAYVRGRTEAGLLTDQRLRGMCGRYAKALLAARSWDPDTLLEAVERFGRTRRSPRFLSEWCSQVVCERENAEHAAAKTEREKFTRADGPRSIADILGVASERSSGAC